MSWYLSTFIFHLSISGHVDTFADTAAFKKNPQLIDITPLTLAQKVLQYFYVWTSKDLISG